MEQNWNIIEGVGNEVTIGLGIVTIFVMIGLRAMGSSTGRRAPAIHPESQREIDDTRLRLQERRSSNAAAAVVSNGDVPRYRRNATDNQCPICLGDARFSIETNCGHLFCGQCIITYWRHGSWLGAVRCPVCRQQVTILLHCHTESEQHSAVLEEIEERNSVNRDINDYNRRFSGEPQAFLDYVRDLPTLLRHLWNEFFSEGGLMYMFRIRIILCFLAASMYFISPLDIIPEAIFGILGLLDDVFVALLLAIYISIVYRRFIANRAQSTN